MIREGEHRPAERAIVERPLTLGVSMNVRVGLLATALLAGTSLVAAAQEQIKLFKVVSPKDEVVIGLTNDELRAMGPRPDIDNLAQTLVSNGQITAWQYAVGRDQGGNLQQTPQKRIAILKNDTLRIEPMTSPLPVAAPPRQ